MHLLLQPTYLKVTMKLFEKGLLQMCGELREWCEVVLTASSICFRNYTLLFVTLTDFVSLPLPLIQKENSFKIFVLFGNVKKQFENTHSSPRKESFSYLLISI